MSITLYWYWTTNPQKVRLALEELGLAYSLKKIHLGYQEHKTDEYKRIHPLQLVPALDIDGGILWESGAALQYLANREQKLQPQDFFMGQNLLFLETGTVQKLAGVHFWQKKIAPLLGKQPDQQAITKATRDLQPLFRILDQQLQQHAYLCGDFSIVDCAYAPWWPYLDLEGWASLQDYQNRITARRSWKICGIRD